MCRAGRVKLPVRVSIDIPNRLPDAAFPSVVDGEDELFGFRAPRTELHLRFVCVVPPTS